MQPQLVLLTACLAFIVTVSGMTTTSSKHSTSASTKTSSSSSEKTTSTSKAPSATPSSVAETYDINVSLLSSQAITFTPANPGQFDERTVNPVLPLLNAVGIEDTIFFNSWVLDDPLTGVVPHSSPNVIVTAAERQKLNGTASLTILYSGSKIKSYDLHYFWFGCAADTAEGAASAAVQCTITVAGFRNNKEVAVASFTFTPPVGQTAAAPMIQAVLPNKFVNLQNTTLAQTDPAVQVINADDFSVTTHT